MHNTLGSTTDRRAGCTSKAASDSSREPCNSSFSISIFFFAFWSSCTLFPPSESWSVRSATSSVPEDKTHTGLQLLQRLFVGRLEFEELAGVQPAFLLAAFHFGHQLLTLLPPVSELLLQDPLLLIQSLAAAAGLGSGNMGSRQAERRSGPGSTRTTRLLSYLLQVHAQLLHLSLQPLFGFLQRGTFGLVRGLSVELGDEALQLLLALLLLLQLLLQHLTLLPHGAQAAADRLLTLAQERGIL
ncbi:hypothetical protein EYF80_039195 [Liparis tanakae]|uniref:Uncharacterized protein n=1 Tax=Liparis tanakae TaxID=230148 RepID=A0A4Z2GBN5_9TELE|nr:hypothetical protein EYF80_039195 [Liparis tanakae]